MARKGKHLIGLYIPQEIYDRVKDNANYRYVPVSNWILQAILMRLAQEKKYE
jgi:hypothetical protein